MKYYFITGTSRGLGHAITLQLLKDDDNFITGISRSKTIDHKNYKHITLDLSDTDKLLSSLPDIFYDLKNAEKIILINNAGVLGQVGHVGNISNEKIREAFNVNIIAPAILTNEFVKKYLSCASCQKIILNVSSGAGKKPVDGWSCYCASKAALDMFSGVIAVEKRMDKNNIRVFSVSPGIVDTAMQDEIRKVSKHDFSRLAEFIEYKKEGMLAPANKIAEKYIHLLENEDKFHDVVVSVRDY